MAPQQAVDSRRYVFSCVWRTVSVVGVALGFAVALAPAKTIVVDGNPSDWTAAAPAQIHSTTINDGEWVYKGEAGDVRTDPTGTVETNMDITEVRFTCDATNLYVLVRLDDVTDTNEVHVAIAIDKDNNASDTASNFIGDESADTLPGLEIASATNMVEFNVAIHNTTPGFTHVELYDDDDGNGTNWFAPTSYFAYVSTTNNLVEARVDLASLGITPASLLRLFVVTFDNFVGWNNDVDTTVDYPTCDALDIMGGTAGVSQNAWDRDLGDRYATLIHGVNLALPVSEWWKY